MSLVDLPTELQSEIARYLAANHKHRSLANLNQACQRLRHATLPALYQTLILFQTDYERLEENAVLEPIVEGEVVPDAWRHTR
jgi:Fe2+ or Zn2+ uptake regulation protein